MNPASVPIRADLVKLEEFLQSDAVPDNCMHLSELDGYLTGLAAGPEPIPMQEWMAELWEGQLPRFADEAQGSDILATIIRRHGEIIQTLEEGEWVIRPILWTNEDGEVLADDWAEGFLKAMCLRWDAWQPLFAHSVRGEALVPILLLCDSEEGEPLIPMRPSPDDPLYQEISKLIPDAVADIYEFWLERELTPQPIRVLPKIGRNDPCPCGSGKKFKRCCAAA